MFFLLDKPAQISSGKYIRDFARNHEIKKIGHTGTLDPFATGLMLVATDEDTKLISFLTTTPKSYEVVIIWGQATTTYDREGEITKVTKSFPDESLIKKELTKMMGLQEQIPPAYSAKQINGQRAYRLARKGTPVVLQPVRIAVYQAELLHHDSARKMSRIHFQVSAGTYIRSLVHTLGLNCHSCATTQELRRTTLGKLTLQDVSQSPLLYSKVLCLPAKEVGIQDLEKLQHGQPLTGNFESSTALVYNEQPVAIAKPGSPVHAKPILVARIQKFLESTRN